MLLAAVAVASAACGGPTAGGTPSSTPTGLGGFTPPFAVPEEVDADLLRPLAGAGVCTATPEPAADVDVPDGLVLPDEAIVTSVEATGPLTNVQGYLPWTPVQYRIWLQFVADGIEVVQIEDEVREAEALVTDGTHRMFAKAQAVCEMGSVFVAVIAPEVSDAQLPTPAGTP